MPGNKPSRRKIRRHQTKEGPHHLRDRRATERQVWEMSRLVQEREFGSAEEMNAFLQEKIQSRQPIVTAKVDPLDQAQDLMYQAWDSRGKRRLQLARKALALSKDCADAYVLLAEEAAESLSEVRHFLLLGVAAGERALGERFFKEEAGHFWGILETRPYMRARQGLAECLWLLGQRAEAIEHYREMLRLNPNDNQGVRFLLASCLLIEGMDAAAGELLKRYPDEIAMTWAYSKALLAFRTGARTRRATLKRALVANPYVPPYLLGLKKLPRRQPEYIRFGDDSEAVDYAVFGLQAWLTTAGALEWLAATISESAALAVSVSGALSSKPPMGAEKGPTIHLESAVFVPRRATP